MCIDVRSTAADPLKVQGGWLSWIILAGSFSYVYVSKHTCIYIYIFFIYICMHKYAPFPACFLWS